MKNSNIGKQFLSELKQYSDYMKWKSELNRYETWKEAAEDVLNVHLLKYGEKVRPLIEEILPSYQNMEFLVSQRNLQYRNELILKNNARLYNCSVLYCYAPDAFNKGFFVLLSGAGLGVNLKNKYVSQLPNIDKREGETVTFVIPDSIEGWAEAAKVLMSSYCSHPALYSEFYGKKIRFDYSEIRPKGAFISGGFKAPGPDGLKNSLDKIETFMDKQLGNSQSIKFRSYIAYNVFMHLSDAVLSGGVRRSAMNIIMDEDDQELVMAKTGHWRTTNPHFARSNNSVGLMKHSFKKERFEELLAMNEGDNDVGFVLLESEDQMFNPCFEIGFDFYSKIKDLNYTVIQFCNLTEINASACKNSDGTLNVDKFYDLCRKASIAGTLQAGYTSLPYLGKETEEIVAGEALLGVSITGWMDNPHLFHSKEILRNGAKIVVDTNKEISKIIGINEAARTTCVKPSGNASVLLKTPSGIHADHSQKYFRIMQLNKESEVAKFLEQKYPVMLEESKWSANNTDYVVYVPIENSKESIFKDSINALEHLKLIKFVQDNWVVPGNNPKNAYNPSIHHNVSNTVIVEDRESVVDYIFNNQDSFVAVSFLSKFGDKDFTQAPFTSILDEQELIDTYGPGILFVSGLIVDGLHYFNNDLWSACDYIVSPGNKLVGTRANILLQKDWLRRAKKIAKNYFKNDIKKTVYAIKDVYLFHKWCSIKREVKDIPPLVEVMVTAPDFVDIDTMGALACSGGACEIPLR